MKIVLFSTIPEELLPTDSDTVSPKIKVLEDVKLSKDQYHLFFLCITKPFCISEKCRGGGTRHAIGQLLDDKYGSELEWTDINIRVEDIHDEEMFYDCHQFDEKIIKKVCLSYDTLIKAPCIDDECHDNDWVGIVDTWKELLNSKKRPDKLLQKEPGLEQFILALDEDDIYSAWE